MSEEELRLSVVAKKLKDAISSPINRQVENFISWVIESFVNEKNLEEAIDSDLDILTLALNHYGLSHSSITPLFRFTLKLYWNEVESYLTDVQRIMDTLSGKPRCAKILDTPRGRDYLNRCCLSAYNQIYDFVWIEEGVV